VDGSSVRVVDRARLQWPLASLVDATFSRVFTRTPHQHLDVDEALFRSALSSSSATSWHGHCNTSVGNRLGLYGLSQSIHSFRQGPRERTLKPPAKKGGAMAWASGLQETDLSFLR
jgi:hypothetical protein